MISNSIPMDSLQYCMGHPTLLVLVDLPQYTLWGTHHYRPLPNTSPCSCWAQTWYPPLTCFLECCGSISTRFFMFTIFTPFLIHKCEYAYLTSMLPGLCRTQDGPTWLSRPMRLGFWYCSTPPSLHCAFGKSWCSYHCRRLQYVCQPSQNSGRGR